MYCIYLLLLLSILCYNTKTVHSSCYDGRYRVDVQYTALVEVDYYKTVAQRSHCLSLCSINQSCAAVHYNGATSVCSFSTLPFFFNYSAPGVEQTAFLKTAHGEGLTVVQFDRNLASGTPIYLGCFKDEADRDLTGVNIWHLRNNNSTNCADYCVSNNYKYAGTQGINCHCGNTYGRYSSGNSTECVMACAGAPSEICGGIWRNSIYATIFAEEYCNQSSVRDNKGAWMAIDGILDTRSLTYSGPPADTWWMVNLGQLSYVAAVVVVNHLPQSGNGAQVENRSHRFHDVLIQVGYKSSDQWQKCAFQDGVLPAGETKEYLCDSVQHGIYITRDMYAIKGTHVKLSLTKDIDGIGNQITVREVEVKGFK